MEMGNISDTSMDRVDRDISVAEKLPRSYEAAEMGGDEFDSFATA